MAKQRTSSQKREQPGGGGGSGKKIKKSKGSHTPGIIFLQQMEAWLNESLSLVVLLEERLFCNMVQ